MSSTDDIKDTKTFDHGRLVELHDEYALAHNRARRVGLVQPAGPVLTGIHEARAHALMGLLSYVRQHLTRIMELLSKAVRAEEGK